MLAIPEPDLIRCVMEAAEVGLAIDGKLCYVVRYKSEWQCQADYKGLVAVAKRAGQITKCDVDVVCENDDFHCGRKDGHNHLEHAFNHRQPRGEVVGAYAAFTLPDGDFQFCYMGKDELDKVQAMAPAKNGPWRTWTDEMRKKCPVRRGLKLISDDPAVVRAIELDDREFEEPAAEPSEPPTVPTSLRRNGKRRAADEAPAEHLDAPEPSQESPEPSPPTAEEVELQNYLDDFSARVGQAETGAELVQLGQEVDQKTAWLGIHGRALRDLIGERGRQIEGAQQQPRGRGKQARQVGDEPE